MLAVGRGVGITELFHELAEWRVLVFFALVTQPGYVWFLFLLGSTIYVAGKQFLRWGIDRRLGLCGPIHAMSHDFQIGPHIVTKQ